MVHPARHDFSSISYGAFSKPGLSCHHGGQGNVMTMGWHMVLELMISAKSRPMRMTRLD
ncbi:hypothetical protein [Novosphingobium sp.]|uniref:hypothetical protein n=1 Tax=Novosphingobium sp. TaxID=1874826 RepID=UPI0031D05B3F